MRGSLPLGIWKTESLKPYRTVSMNTKTRATLLERLGDGADRLAWDEFFDRYWRLIYAAATRRGCSEHTAEEIVQEVMLAVFEKREVFRYDPAQGRFRDWLAALVRNKVAEHRRRPGGRIRARGGDSSVDLLERQAADARPEAVWEAAWEEALLVALLELVRREVNPRTYQAFELFTLHEMRGAQVARITGQSRNAVYLARKKVFARLKQLGAPYRTNGQLGRRLKQALQSQPDAAVERPLTIRVAKTMQSR
jgi:RNA polymerase sigma-70 factor (ECF subfamily)